MKNCILIRHLIRTPYENTIYSYTFLLKFLQESKLVERSVKYEGVEINDDEGDTSSLAINAINQRRWRTEALEISHQQLRLPVKTALMKKEEFHQEMQDFARLHVIRFRHIS